MHWLRVLDSAVLGGELGRKKAAGKVLKTACFPFFFFFLTLFRAEVQGCMISYWATGAAIAMYSHLTGCE